MWRKITVRLYRYILGDCHHRHQVSLWEIYTESFRTTQEKVNLHKLTFRKLFIPNFPVSAMSSYVYVRFQNKLTFCYWNMLCNKNVLQIFFKMKSHYNVCVDNFSADNSVLFFVFLHQKNFFCHSFNLKFLSFRKALIPQKIWLN